MIIIIMIIIMIILKALFMGKKEAVSLLVTRGADIES